MTAARRTARRRRSARAARPSRSRPSSGRPPIRSSPASAARISAPIRQRRRISRGRSSIVRASAPSAATALQPGRHLRRGRVDVLGRRLQPRVREAGLPERPARGQHDHRRDARRPRRRASRRAPRTGALVYLSLPPDGQAGSNCGARLQHRLVRHRRHLALLPAVGRRSWRSPTRSTAAGSA